MAKCAKGTDGLKTHALIKAFSTVHRSVTYAFIAICHLHIVLTVK